LDWKTGEVKIVDKTLLPSEATLDRRVGDNEELKILLFGSLSWV